MRCKGRPGQLALFIFIFSLQVSISKPKWHLVKVKSNDNGEEGGYYYEGDEDHLSLHHNEDGDLNDNHVEPELGTDQLINPDKRDIIDSDDGNPTVAEIKVLCLHTELTFV